MQKIGKVKARTVHCKGTGHSSAATQNRNGTVLEILTMKKIALGKVSSPMGEG